MIDWRLCRRAIASVLKMLEPGLEGAAFESLTALHQAVIKILDADADAAQQVGRALPSHMLGCHRAQYHNMHTTAGSL